MKKSPINKVSAKQKKELALRGRLKKQLLKECNNLCMNCGGTGFPFGLTLSHIVALSRGGKTERGNLEILCLDCHNKFEKHPERRENALEWPGFTR